MVPPSQRSRSPENSRAWPSGGSPSVRPVLENVDSGETRVGTVEACFSANFAAFAGSFSVKLMAAMPRASAKIRNRARARKPVTNALDKASDRKPKGRPRKIEPSWVRGKADNYRDVFSLIWDHFWPALSKATTQQEAIQAFASPGVGGYALDLIRQADLILRVVRDPKFPTRQRQAQINFMADSIAAFGVLTPRSSRDVCEKERARIKRIHRILLYEFYIECSCGYKGNSRNHACPKCEAHVPFKEEIILNFS